MRTALISDIHGNLIALEAVLSDIERQQVDALVCLGDVATIGPQPKEVLARLRTLDCSFIEGNHDAALLKLDSALDYQVSPLLIATLHWCAHLLDDEDVAFLRSFKTSMELPLGEGDSVYCYHGSPLSNIDLLLSTTPSAELDHYFSGLVATVMAGGHTHIPMLRQHHGTLVVNPGSVGSAFLEAAVSGVTPTLLPWANYAIVSQESGELSVDSRRVSFDLAAFSETVLGSDIPIKNWWLQQYSSTRAH